MAAVSASDRAAAGTIQDRIVILNKGRRSFGKIQALYDVGPPPRTFLLKRGNHETPGEEVEPGLLSILSEPGRSRAPSAAGATSGRRLALAAALTEPDSR